MTDIIYGGALGLLAALAFNRIAIFQIKQRTDESSKIEAVKNTATIVVWVLLSGILFAAIYAIIKDTAARLEAMAYISIAISIGIVDLDIKKIPLPEVLEKIRKGEIPDAKTQILVLRVCDLLGIR